MPDVHHTLLDDGPPLPGLVIRREILDRFKISQTDLALAVGIHKVRVHYLLTGRNPVSAEIALRLGKVTATDPAYWMELQSSFDLYLKHQEMRDALDELVTLAAQADAL